MPFRSEAQRRWMYANHPAMAAEWEAHTPKGAKLPKKKRKKKTKAFDESKHPRGEHGQWAAAFADWHEQAGRTAHSKPREQHEAEAISHRERLMKLPMRRLKELAGHVGYSAQAGTTKEKFIAGLLSVVHQRRGMAQRVEMSIRHPWQVKAMGRFDPSKHPRDHGKFSRSAGAGASAAPPGEMRHNPELDAMFDEREAARAGKPPTTATPATPPAPRPNLAKPTADRAKNPPHEAGVDIFSLPPGTQNLREFPKSKPAALPHIEPLAPLPGHYTPNLGARVDAARKMREQAAPHAQTQQAALHAARSVKPGDHASHAAAVQALGAHERAGLAELRRRAQTAGPRAGNMYRKAAQQFKQKLSAARAKIDQLAGKGPPPVPRKPGQPPPLNQRGKIPHPWVPMEGGTPEHERSAPMHPQGPTPMPGPAAPKRERPAPSSRSKGGKPHDIRRLQSFMKSDRFRRMGREEQSQYRSIMQNYRSRGRYHAGDLKELMDHIDATRKAALHPWLTKKRDGTVHPLVAAIQPPKPPHVVVERVREIPPPSESDQEKAFRMMGEAGLLEITHPPAMWLPTPELPAEVTKAQPEDGGLGDKLDSLIQAIRNQPAPTIINNIPPVPMDAITVQAVLPPIDLPDVNVHVPAESIKVELPAPQPRTIKVTGRNFQGQITEATVEGGE